MGIQQTTLRGQGNRGRIQGIHYNVGHVRIFGRRRGIFKRLSCLARHFRYFVVIKKGIKKMKKIIKRVAIVAALLFALFIILGLLGVWDDDESSTEPKAVQKRK